MLAFRGLIYSVLNKLNINGTSDFQKTIMKLKVECESRCYNKHVFYYTNKVYYLHEGNIINS